MSKIIFSEEWEAFKKKLEEIVRTKNISIQTIEDCLGVMGELRNHGINPKSILERKLFSIQPDLFECLVCKKYLPKTVSQEELDKAQKQMPATMFGVPVVVKQMYCENCDPHNKPLILGRY